MDVLIRFLSESMGIPYDTVEGSIATLASLFVVFLLKLLWDSSKRDNKQVDLEQTLAQLAIRSLNSYDANTKTIEENTAAIRQVVEVLEGMGVSFAAFAGEMSDVKDGLRVLAERAQENQPVLEEIKDNLLKTSKTVVLIKDSSGELLTQLTAEPDGTGNLVVQFSPVEQENGNG